MVNYSHFSVRADVPAGMMIVSLWFHRSSAQEEHRAHALVRMLNANSRPPFIYEVRWRNVPHQWEAAPVTPQKNR